MKPVSQITNRLKKPMQDLVYGHRLSYGSIFQLLRDYLEVHCPEYQEEYTDGSIAVFAYLGKSWEQFKVRGPKRKVRPLGDIMFDIEDAVMELCHDHDLQWYEVFAVFKVALQKYAPAGQEIVKGQRAQLYYGPVEGLRKIKRHLKKYEK